MFKNLIAIRFRIDLNLTGAIKSTFPAFSDIAISYEIVQLLKYKAIVNADFKCSFTAVLTEPELDVPDIGLFHHVFESWKIASIQWWESLKNLFYDTMV